jgi:1,4-dihydroxy-2-naphthoate polyprenyltransferase
MSNILKVTQTFRPSFLILTPICIFLSISLATFNGIEVNNNVALLAFIAALLAHVSVNALNEYLDFDSGLDFKTSKTPFSGGSGTLPNFPELANMAKWLGIISLLITFAIGAYFVFYINVDVLWFGVIGLFIVVFYTRWLNKLPLLCLISPGIGFSTIMVLGTYLLFSPSMPTTVILVAFIPFLQINNLLLLNQYPDIEPDKIVGRKTFPIAFGVPSSNLIYAASAITPYVILSYLVMTNALPLLSLIALLTAPIALFSAYGAFKYRASIGQQPKYMAANVACSLLTPLILAVSLYG